MLVQKSRTTLGHRRSSLQTKGTIPRILCHLVLLFVLLARIELHRRGHRLCDRSKGKGVPWEAKFLEYIPSAWEVDWKTNIVSYQNDPCIPLLNTTGARLLEDYINVVHSYKVNRAKKSDENSPNEILSHFVYLLGSRKFQVAIEPLIGYFRHPYAIPDCVPKDQFPVSVLNLSYIVFRGMPLTIFESVYPGRKFLFDLGLNGPNRSLEWLDHEYRQNGIQFDGIWGWDSRPFEPVTFWQNVPKSIYSKLHLINVPVANNFSDMGHPFQIVKRVFRKGDYIALKLDIDAPGYEQTLADELLYDDELSEMIADFFYEKHLGAPHFPYHRLPHDDSVHNLKSVIEFFSSLRERGIRAHYWV